MLKIDWSLLDHCEQCRILKLEPCPEYRYWNQNLKNAKNFDFQHADLQTKQHLSLLALCHRNDYREWAEEQTNQQVLDIFLAAMHDETHGRKKPEPHGRRVLSCKMLTADITPFI